MTCIPETPSSESSKRLEASPVFHVAQTQKQTKGKFVNIKQLQGFQSFDLNATESTVSLCFQPNTYKLGPIAIH